MVRVARVLFMVLAAALGLTTPPTASSSAAAASPTVATYVYDGHHQSAPPISSTPERGPPASYNVITGFNATDCHSQVVSPRPNAAAAGTTTTYSARDALVQVAHPMATTEAQPSAAHSHPVAFARGRVAANAVGKAPQVLRVGDVKLSAVPKGAVGTPTQTGKGLEYAIPRGTPELDPRVVGVRIMDPVAKGKYQYPSGYSV